jgi:hypothetical protein
MEQRSNQQWLKDQTYVTKNQFLIMSNPLQRSVGATHWQGLFLFFKGKSQKTYHDFDVPAALTKKLELQAAPCWWFIGSKELLNQEVQFSKQQNFPDVSQWVLRRGLGIEVKDEK